MNDTCVWYIVPSNNWDLGLEMTCSPEGIKRLRILKLKDAPLQKEDVQQRADAFGQQHPWFWKAVAALEAYFQGLPVEFDDIPVDLADQPPFRKKVQEQCRKIGYGHTTTYADLARVAGLPAAARAVGSAMSHNPVPIIIPCHRVLRTDGGLGGYNAPDGVTLKQQLLHLEGIQL